MTLPTNLPALLRKHGLKVVEIPGWQTRGRPASTGGFHPVGVLCHHTASGDNGMTAIPLLVRGRSDLPGPLCQLSLDRQGTVYLVAAGRANHAGVAKPSGTVGGGDGNVLYIGIEAQNRGTGEPWPKAQYDAYVTLAAALSVEITHDSAQTVRGHKETSIEGKVDPHGPTPYGKTFDMDVFRTKVAAAIKAMQAPAQKPAAKPKVKHKVGTYNVEHGHPVKPHVEMILKRFEDQHEDLLALVEVSEYVEELAKAAAAAGHQLVYVDGPGYVKNQAMLVRKGLSVGHFWSVPTKATFFATNGDLRHTSCPLAVWVDDVLYLVVHAPVGAWITTMQGRRLTGPIRRVLAYREFFKVVRAFVNRHKRHPILLLGDWNGNPTSVGPYSPNRLRRNVGGKFIRPRASTGHGEIDFAIGRGVTGTFHVRPDPAGEPHSDHKLVDGTVAT